MPVEFSQAGRMARDRINAPNVPLDGIRHRAQAANRRQRVALASIVAALVFASVSVGTGAAQRAYQGVRIWISGSRGAMVLHSLAIIRDPMPADIRAIAHSAAFQVIFPSGIPAGTRIIRIMYTPADHPNTIAVGYLPKHGKQFDVTLVQTSSIDNGQLPPGASPMSVTVRQVGEESVVAQQRFPSPKFLQWNDTPEQSLARAEAFAAPIHIMEPHAEVVDAAERIAAGNSRAVIIGRPYTQTIPQLAREHKPLLEARDIVLVNIGQKNGSPDFANARQQFPKVVAVDARGVEALNAALQRRPCTCPMLIVPSGNSYRVWQFDLNGNVL